MTAYLLRNFVYTIVRPAFRLTETVRPYTLTLLTTPDMKQMVPSFILSLTAIIACAQEPVQPSISLSLDGGRSFSSATSKKNGQMGNGFQLGGDIFLPLSGKGKIGIIAGGQYLSAKNIDPEVTPLLAKYKLPTGNLDIMDTHDGPSNSQGFMAFAGVRVDFRFGKITCSPSISGGYFSLDRSGFTQSSQIMVNGAYQTIVLSSSPRQTCTGFITIPRLKVSYGLTDNLGIYVAGAIDVGPSISNMQSQLVPAGGFNDKNTYEAQQLASGKLSLDGGSKDAGHFIASSIHIGLSWSLGSSSQRHRKGKVIKSSDGGVMPRVALVAGQPIGGIVVKGGKSPGGSMMAIITNNKGAFEFTAMEDGNYLFVVSAPGPTGPSQVDSSAPQNDTKTVNPLYQDGGHQGTNPMFDPKAFVASPGQPIGGIVVKGGKNPGGSALTIITTSDGTFQLNDIKAGNYRFVITAPKPLPGEGISEKGIK
jgi:hypothetical protein